jgi:hypothetical protein
MEDNSTRFKKGHKINKKYDYDPSLSPQAAFYRRNKDVLGKRAKEKQREYRITALKHYGGGEPHCNCCGETIIEFLSFDHINGGGTKHRKKIGGGIALYLIKNNFPLDFQVLCHNCNQAKEFYGDCPHNKQNG